MCGPTGEQQATYAAQSKFQNLLNDNYSTMFGEYQGILNSVTKGLTPIFNAGPSQTGFSPEERAALKTQATESTAQGYANAKEALGEEVASRGGDTAIESGADTEASARLMSEAERSRADLGTKITLADYDTGRQNYDAARSGLLQTAGLENPVGTADAANAAGSAAAKTADEIAAESDSVWKTAVGAIGGVAGSAVGGWAKKGGN